MNKKALCVCVCVCVCVVCVCVVMTGTIFRTKTVFESHITLFTQTNSPFGSMFYFSPGVCWDTFIASR